MSIVKKEFYGVKCDVCGEVCESGEFQYWSDPGCAVDEALCDEWVEINNKHYCEDDGNEIKKMWFYNLLTEYEKINLPWKGLDFDDFEDFFTEGVSPREVIEKGLSNV